MIIIIIRAMVCFYSTPMAAAIICTTITADIGRSNAIAIIKIGRGRMAAGDMAADIMTANIMTADNIKANSTKANSIKASITVVASEMVAVILAAITVMTMAMHPVMRCVGKVAEQAGGKGNSKRRDRAADFEISPRTISIRKAM